MKRAVLVTGGGRRVGAAIVRALAAAGHGVVIHSHRADDADAAALVLEVTAGGGRAWALGGELGDDAAARDILARARSAAGSAIDGLVNCASMFAYDALPLADARSLREHMAVNLAAPVLLASTLAAQDDLAGGAVVNLLDQKLANLNPDFFSYTCSKAALEAATRMMAQAWGPRIRVNAVAPGLTLPSLDQTAEEFELVARENLLRRVPNAADVADAVGFLMEACGVSGQTIHVDNGQRFVRRDRDVMFATRMGADG